MGWSYDAVGNRASEVSGGTTKTCTTPATSNRLSTVTQGTTTLRTFGYDAAGAIATDAKAGVTWTSTYDAEGRVVQAQSGTFTVGTYVYDARSKLAKRTVSNVTPAVATHYLYDPDGHVIAETTSAGVTTREYIWLDDMPVAVIDAVNTATPVTYFVHTDHLMRPLKMTNAMQAVAWDAVWKPFGETFSITSAPKLDLGFPGQWTRSENGLAWNWHRHYDPTTGRYTKPDPLRFVDGPSLYGYAGQRPNVLVDKDGHFAQILVAICKTNPAMCVAAAAAAGAYVSNVFNNPAIIPNDPAIIPKDPARSPNVGVIPEKCGVWPIVRPLPPRGRNCGCTCRAGDANNVSTVMQAYAEARSCPNAAVLACKTASAAAAVSHQHHVQASCSDGKNYNAGGGLAK